MTTDDENTADCKSRIKNAIKAVFEAAATSNSNMRIAVLLELLHEEHTRSATSVDLPDKAPEAWAERDLNRRENPCDFVKRVYAKWIGNGLTRVKIKELDYPLYRALSVWFTRHPDTDLSKLLPRLTETINTRFVIAAQLHSFSELRSLGLTLQTRHRRAQKKGPHSEGPS
jgi:hypothetical protein